MLQIFFNQADYGPSKVINNLLLGLKKAKEPYICNPIDIETDDPIICLNEHPILYSHLISYLSIGPNICVVPTDNPVVMRKEYKKFIINSDWTFNQYKNYIPEDMLEIWPVGIDTNLFPEVISNKGNLEPIYDCLIYFKRRSEKELNETKELLDSFNQKYIVVEYGKYTEEDFKKIIKNSRYCFSLNSTESQGIALQEIMSSNLPMFVWDVKTWKDRGQEYACPATSVPYWGNICGEKTTKKKEIKDLFSKFLSELDLYNPRQYVLENLGLKQQAKRLLDLL